MAGQAHEWEPALPVVEVSKGLLMHKWEDPRNWSEMNWPGMQFWFYWVYKIPSEKIEYDFKVVECPFLSEMVKSNLCK